MKLKRITKKELANDIFDKFIYLNPTFNRLLKKALRTQVDSIAYDIYSNYEYRLDKYLKKYDAKSFKFDPYAVSEKEIRREVLDIVKSVFV